MIASQTIIIIVVGCAMGVVLITFVPLATYFVFNLYRFQYSHRQ